MEYAHAGYATLDGLTAPNAHRATNRKGPLCLYYIKDKVKCLEPARWDMGYFMDCCGGCPQVGDAAINGFRNSSLVKQAF
jgi:hypothetical protein